MTRILIAAVGLALLGSLSVGCATQTPEQNGEYTEAQNAAANYPPPTSKCDGYPRITQCANQNQCPGQSWCDVNGNTGGCCCSNPKPAVGNLQILSFRDIGCNKSCNDLNAVPCRQDNMGRGDATKPCWVTRTNDPGYNMCNMALAANSFLDTLGLDARKVPGGNASYRFCKCTGTCNAVLYNKTAWANGSGYEGCGTSGRGANGGKCPALVCPGDTVLNCTGMPVSENCNRPMNNNKILGPDGTPVATKVRPDTCVDCCTPCASDESCDPCQPPPEDTEDQVDGRY